MRGHPDDIDQALTTLDETVADQLSAGGWACRLLDDRPTATLTRPTQNGVMAVVGIARTSFHWPDDWPIAVEAYLGVGYEPALNLMPLLTPMPFSYAAVISGVPGPGWVVPWWCGRLMGR